MKCGELERLGISVAYILQYNSEWVNLCLYPFAKRSYHYVAAPNPTTAAIVPRASETGGGVLSIAYTAVEV